MIEVLPSLFVVLVVCFVLMTLAAVYGGAQWLAWERKANQLEVDRSTSDMRSARLADELATEQLNHKRTSIRMWNAEGALNHIGSQLNQGGLEDEALIDKVDTIYDNWYKAREEQRRG